MNLRALHDWWYEIEPRVIGGLLGAAALLGVALAYVIAMGPGY